MSEQLKYIFSNVNEWLKFAEAKIAGLLALNAASMFGVLQSQNNFVNEHKIFLVIILVLVSVSILCCVYSIVPDLRVKRFNRKLEQNIFQSEITNINPLFFGSISKLTTDQYIELLKDREPSFHLAAFDKELINQIVVNSEIANFKYSVFNIASWFTFVAFCAGILAIVFKIFI
ncbi:MAG: hypothetical protein EOO43_23860 [Flavobacterium sp.]|nr:MAG: hypothetical protein EOO43_23860 [Flavobacterium sp.]